MKSLALILLFTISLVSSAFGKIGDSLMEMENAYGRGKKTDMPRRSNVCEMCYEKNGLRITAQFISGKVVYQRMDKWEKFTDEEVKAILNDNSNRGMAWKESKNQDGQPQFDREDGKVFVIHGSDTIGIYDTAHWKKERGIR